ncbi:MAG: glycerophosphodiester phosphodiesterase [Ilumatobacteraceae bacterium]|nr:MAG: glycerophosphodiester phosphodiesterase [Actinomycetota bacterium]
MQQRLPSLLDPPVAFAHRGARAHAPENTIEAFALALRLGATGLESDVWLSADGEAVLDHDGVVKTGRRKRAIVELARVALPSHMPTLAEVLDAVGTDFHLSLDLKHDGAGPAVLAAVRGTDPTLEERLWLCHPRLDVLVALRAHTEGAKLVDSTRLERVKEGPERRAATLRERGIDAINLHRTDWTGGLTTLFHRFDRFALGWDMQHEHELRAGLRMGLDGVFSDHVDTMMDALRAEGDTRF